MFIDATIVNYHQITENNPPKGSLNISARQFMCQMYYLYTHSYRCLPLSKLLQLSESERRRSKALAITFDDGYEDFITTAYPILHHYNFTATLFIVTDLVGQYNSWDGKAKTPLLAWEQIKRLRDKGFSFESHTCTHPILTKLPQEQSWHELTASKACLEAKLGQEAHVLAYPYGDSDQNIWEMAKAVGYKAACGIGTGKNDPFNLWRWVCRAGEDISTFAFKLSPLYRYLYHLRKETRMGRMLSKLTHSLPVHSTPPN